jgi:hypothetical protein
VTPRLVNNVGNLASSFAGDERAFLGTNHLLSPKSDLNERFALLPTVVIKFALCGPRIEFCNRMDATVAACSLRSRVDSRLWRPDPIDSKTDALTFYMSGLYM